MYILVNLFTSLDSEDFLHAIEYISTAYDMEIDLKVLLTQESLSCLTKEHLDKDNLDKLKQLNLFDIETYYLEHSFVNIESYLKDKDLSFIQTINKNDFKSLFNNAKEIVTF